MSVAKLRISHIISYYNKWTCITYVYSTMYPNYLDHIECIFSQLTLVSLSGNLYKLLSIVLLLICIVLGIFQKIKNTV